jgi:hypothetical protein
MSKTTKENDSKILELKRKIELKKKSLEKVTFLPQTNCSLELDNQRYNIQVLSKEQLNLLLIRVNMYKMSAEDLDIDCVLSGYGIDLWLTDISTRLNLLSRKEEEKKLKDLEDTLHQLLSGDKKTEMKIQEVESLLK